MNKQHSRYGLPDKGADIGRRIRSRDWSLRPRDPVATWDAALDTLPAACAALNTPPSVPANALAQTVP